MNYFTKELMTNVCSPDAIGGTEIGLEYEREWERVYKRYKEYFSKFKNRFSKAFLNEFDNNGAFHDFELKSITYSYENSSVVFALGTPKYDYALKYTGVKAYKFDLPQDAYIDYHIDWGYCEFEMIDEKLLKHNILFLGRDYIDCEITFRHVSVKKRRK